MSTFATEVLVDFVDDAFVAPVPLTAAHIDSMMRYLKGVGIARVSWAYYADERGGHHFPCRHEQDEYDAGHWANLAETYRLLGNPLRLAVEAAHRYGMELYAYFKPYETGPAVLYPEGAPESHNCLGLDQIGGRLVWVDPFILEYQHLRIRRRNNEAADNIDAATVNEIRLKKKDASPTRVNKQHLQIWTSPDNYRYKLAAIDFDFRESIECAPEEVNDLSGKVLTRKGEPIRVLYLWNLELRDRYILITTNFASGPADFENAGTSMLSAYDRCGHEIPGIFGRGQSIYLVDSVDFRNWGLIFDDGYGAQTLALDEPNFSGRSGVIAFARGRNGYLPGALCETEPRVREFWLSCVRAMLKAGVDGVDFRVESHSTHTDRPDEYGYNDCIVQSLTGSEELDCTAFARIRGHAFTEFLRQAKHLIAGRQKRTRINMELDYYRPNPPVSRRLAYPANVDFEWRRWIEEGIADEAILRFFVLSFDQVLKDDIAREFLERCRKRSVPVYFNRYVYPKSLREEYRCIRGDARFSGFVCYETSSFLRFGAQGTCSCIMDEFRDLGNER